jgi:hypothetical protein
MMIAGNISAMLKAGIIPGNDRSKNRADGIVLDWIEFITPV